MDLKATIWDEKISAAHKLLESCILCGNRCKVNRLAGEKGICKAPNEIIISSYTAHHGEEPVFSGTKGSGTIFFSYCSLSCVYCQNYEISQNHLGYKVSREELADIMISLQEQGCHNINLVSPTHFMPQILGSIKIAKSKGLNIPILYNSNGYDSVELLKILEGVIDIYMPDFKYFDNKMAMKYSKAKNYVETAKNAIKEMFRQVGVLSDGKKHSPSLLRNSPRTCANHGFLKKCGAQTVLAASEESFCHHQNNDDQIAQKGLLVRHLVLPDNISSSKKVLEFLSTISLNIWVSIMSQYSPQYKAENYKEINKPIDPNGYNEVVEYAKQLGFNNLLAQEMESTKVYLPDFKKENPFE